MRRILGIICVVLVLFTGCSRDETEIPPMEEVTHQEIEFKEVQLDFYIQEEMALAPYEPMNGVYLGAYVERNAVLDNDIKKFEEQIGQKQAFRVFQYNSDDPISSSDVLECIANKQVPYIKYLFDDTKGINDVYHLIGDLSSVYRTPMFIELYPVTSSMTNPKTYNNQYQEAYQLIKRYLSESTIVWSIDHTRVEDVSIYYPGDEYVDWVGLNMFLPRLRNGEIAQDNYSSIIDMWYKTFQSTKPMMLTSLGVSYFSSEDYIYTTSEAKDKLEYFYSELPEKYPRIKGILYVDANMQEMGGKEDYRISVETAITSHVNMLMENDIFLHELQTHSDDVADQYIYYSIPALTYGDKYYIESIYAQEIFDPHLLVNVPVFRDLEGTVYYPTDEITKYINAFYIP
ncbi:MAG: hypothetical protein ATN36_07565 [Epulopiscium sp. Nele67-Bin005]|nr:MAG: hypothetical protein ATN36_07565 [Epulopiscium sp. Nele67-Bin005]